MRDLIDAPIERLLQDRHEDYVTQSEFCHAMKDDVVPGMRAIADAEMYSSERAMAQALFESGFLTLGETDPNLDKLLSLIFGAKVHKAIKRCQALFFALDAFGANQPTRALMYKGYGENHYCALRYEIKPTAEDIDIHESLMGFIETEKPDPLPSRFRDVIYIETHSTAFAIVMEYAFFRPNTPRQIHLLRLREAPDGPNPINAMMDDSFTVDPRGSLSPFNPDRGDAKLITTLDVDTMECRPVLAPKLIEKVLYEITSAYSAIQREVSAVECAPETPR